MKRKSLSQTLISAARDLGFSKKTVKDLESMSVPEVSEYSAKQIKIIRKRANVSQGVFAEILSVHPSTLQKWEQGKEKPQPIALRLLQLISSYGVDIVMKAT